MSTTNIKDKHHQGYIDLPSLSNPKRISRFLPLISFNKQDLVIDAGCGMGLLLSLIHSKIKFYYGIDFSKEMFNRALNKQKQLNINNARFICGDINNFCLKHKNEFDKAFALDFSEHLDDQDFMKIFSSLHFCLKPKGSLFIHTPNGEYFLEVFKKIGIMKSAPEHIGIRDKKRIYKIIQKSRFF